MTTTKAPRFTEREARELHARALAAAEQAATAAKPTAMYVGTPRDPVASLMGGDGGGLDPDKDIWRVADGVCGMAWVTIYPGNSSLARRLAKMGAARRGYYGGMEVYRPGYNGQSYERGMAAANAYAATLQEAGVTAYTGGRLD